MVVLCSKVRHFVVFVTLLQILYGSLSSHVLFFHSTFKFVPHPLRF